MFHLRRFLAWSFGLMLLAGASSALAQAKLDKPQLDQLLAPVALYPDALLSQVLMASTYPADVASAAEWSKSNQSLSGDAATKAVEGEPWDPSVKSLTAFPSVMDMMGRQPQWVESVGDAFLAQPDDVMDSVQRLRVQAQKAGTLKSNEQQKVVTQQSGGTTIVQIEPASPQVVYVPSYNPTVVYGAWPYPAYPPAYYPPPPGSVFATSLVAGIGFGLGVAAVNSMWGGFNWGSHDVNINVNRYNNINVNQRLDVNRSNVNWQHNPANRGNVPYRNQNVANRYDAQRQRAAQSFQGRTGQSIPGHSAPNVNRQAGGQNPRPAGADRQRADQADARNRARDSNRNNAFSDAGNGDRMRQQANRGDRSGFQHNAGQVQQHSAPARSGGGIHGGGGGGGSGFHGGGGGGFQGGGHAGGAGAGGGHLGHGRR